ncbi:MAG: hypothetical protein LLF97_09425 [Planctomycetaceae bacterium]|nr:hypothetical protein [Planctomycetaceae bacterium]
MKRMSLGALVGLAVVVAAAVAAEPRGELRAPTASPVAAVGGSELFVVPTSLGERGQLLTVVDPRQRVLSVYHIDATTGKITLKSVRNIQWDLQMMYLNNENPLPPEIRSLLEQR